MNENRFHPGSRTDKLLVFVEVLSVLSIALGLVFFIGYEIYWVARPGTGTIQCRIQTVLNTVNENWKAGLLILIPLFYRTVRTFLELVKKGPWGIERDIPQKEPNPQRKKR